jgi:hypothetical protein
LEVTDEFGLKQNQAKAILSEKLAVRLRTENKRQKQFGINDKRLPRWRRHSNTPISNSQKDLTSGFQDSRCDLVEFHDNF